jgi:hypothetical protein
LLKADTIQAQWFYLGSEGSLIGLSNSRGITGTSTLRKSSKCTTATCPVKARPESLGAQLITTNFPLYIR